MRLFLLACLAIAVVSGDQETCEPGSVSMQDCNSCICSKDGKTRMCTLMMCDPAKHLEEIIENPLLRKTRQLSDDRPCVPGERFKNYCNTCTCGADGFSVACTRRACPKDIFNEDGSLKHPEQFTENPLVRERRQVSDDRPCVPGERFKNYCNTCTCGADGFSVACTRRGCPKDIFNEDGSLKHPEQFTENPLLRKTRQVSDDRPCVPGERFKNYCNTCTCGADGFSVACTRRGCPKDIFNEDGSLKHPEQVTENPLLRKTRQVSDDRPCVPGERFKNYCNTCTCGADGFSVACTRMSCPKHIFNQDGSLKHPEQITENPLVRERRQVSSDRPCVPGERFKNYCNTCTCGADGFSVACTRRGCPKDIFNEDGSLKHPEQVTEKSLLRERRQVSSDRPCVPGERFKDYCNTCTCGADGFSVACTRMSCPKHIFNQDGSLKHPEQFTENPLVRERRQVSSDRPCVPGERFKDYCNTCTCGADGFSVACTKKACPKHIFNQDGSLKHPEQITENPLVRERRQVSSDRPCVPGERFKDYCNTCTCGADGFSVSCTRMACPKHIFNQDGSLKHPEQFTENPLVRERRQVSSDRPCVPGERFKDYCNTCTCGADGFSVSCTRMACPKHIFNEDGSLKHPEQVTEKSLLRERRQVSSDRPCVPGERFKDYCNTCTCGADGFSVACTRMSCPKHIFNEDGSLKHPEQVTEKSLLRERRQVSDDGSCVPGSVFMEDCNSCICSKDGKSRMCTMMMCHSAKHPEEITLNPLLRKTPQDSD